MVARLGAEVMVLDPKSKKVRIGKLVGTNYNRTCINGKETESDIFTVEVNGNPRDLITVDRDFVKFVDEVIDEAISEKELIIRSIDYENKIAIVGTSISFLDHEFQLYITDEDKNVEVVDESTITILGNDDECDCDDCDGCNEMAKADDLTYDDGYMDGFAEAYRLFAEWFSSGATKTTLDNIWDEIGGDKADKMRVSDFDPREVCAKFIEKISKEA